MRLQTILFLTGIVYFFSTCSMKQETRQRISLSGTWEIAQGSIDEIPNEFSHTVPVPGLVDMSTPAFNEVGIESDLREVFWYRRTFSIEGDVPVIAQLKINKAKFSSGAILNGEPLGEHYPNFTPGYFDVSHTLKGNGEENVILIRVGADRSSNPDNIADGWDFEKTLYLPGIYDEVELILSGTPHIVRTQVAPDIEENEALIQTVIKNTGEKKSFQLNYSITEKQSGKVVTTATSNPIELAIGEEKTIQTRIAIPEAHLWCPEDPFLYSLQVSTGADDFQTNFGMRSFEVKEGYTYLNGKKYFLRGSNVTMYRFFEDPDRKSLPWDKEWVRDFHEKIKDMNMNSLRYCIGFPPEFWYDIADEVGILLQDEYPIWYLAGLDSPIMTALFGVSDPVELMKIFNAQLDEMEKQGNIEAVEELKRRMQMFKASDEGIENLDSEKLKQEFEDWMHERANHPSVVIWDAQNETHTVKTGEAIAGVRQFDLSNRPWDNGWEDAAEGEFYESHNYYLRENDFTVIGELSGDPTDDPNGRTVAWRPNTNNKAAIINEYGWLWLNRDGSPTTLTDNVYLRFLGENSTIEERRDLNINYLSALTEFFRCHRKCAGVLHFCTLGYSRPQAPRGQTSDHFMDIENLEFEPLFEKYIKYAFSPVGLMLNLWEKELEASDEMGLEVYVINDLYEGWEGDVKLRIEKEGIVVDEYSMNINVDALGQEILSYSVDLSLDPGDYKFIAELTNSKGEIVQSIRNVKIVTSVTE